MAEIVYIIFVTFMVYSLPVDLLVAKRIIERLSVAMS